MKQNKGFTLIELLAVIVILAVIALIATPLIMGTITNAKKNAFKDTAYGILKAGELYTAETLLTSENTYPGETITIPESGSKKLNYKGQEPRGGQMVITKDGDIFLVIYNDSWCAIKNASDKEVVVEKYDKDTCKVNENAVKTLAQLIINKNITNNQEGLFTDDYGNTRYRGSNGEVKNYVTFNHELWRIIGVFDGKVKLIRSESIGSMNWNNNSSNNWDTSTLKTYLNGDYYNSLSNQSKTQIETSTFYLGGHNTTEGMYARTMYEKERGTTVYTGNSTRTNQNVGLIYPSDYGYAARSSCSNDLYNYDKDENCSTDGNWLYNESNFWLQTPESSRASNAFCVSSSGDVFDGAVVFSWSRVAYFVEVHPSIYLKSNVISTSGDGTSSNPYTVE